MQLGRQNIAYHHLKFCSTVVIWPYLTKSYGQASGWNSISQLHKCCSVGGNVNPMLARGLISILLTVVTGYLFFMVRNNLISGMNPYINGVLAVIPIILLTLNYVITKKINDRFVGMSLRIIMLLGVLIPIFIIFFRKPNINNQNPPRRYIDSSGLY